MILLRHGRAALAHLHSACSRHSACSSVRHGSRLTLRRSDGMVAARPFVAQELKKARAYVCGDTATSTDSRFVPQVSLIVLTSDVVDHS